MISAFLIVALAVIFGFFFTSDCDFFLKYSPFDAETAFSNKVIWIIGASSGIGEYLAYELSKAGAQVIISARRLEQLEMVAKNCSNFNKLKPYVLPMDILDYEGQIVAYKSIIEKFGHVDSLVLNAGRTMRSTAIEAPIKLTRNIFELNFFSYIQLSKLVLPDMIKRQDGQLVILSSLAGRIGTPLSSSYSATKFALHGYYDALRAEVSADNVHISVVCPGPVESEIVSQAFRSEQDTIANQDTEGNKMPTERCSHLIAKGMFHKVDEMWISRQPYLFLVYLASYAPWTARQVFKYVGPRRVKVYRDGGSPFDMKAVINAKL